MDGFKSLFRSRKVLLACLGVLNTIVLHYFKIDTEVWLSIDALIGVVIAGIAVEDHGTNSAGSNQAISGETVNVTNPPADPERKANGDLRDVRQMDPAAKP